MKWYWHLLTFIVAIIAAWFTSDWLAQPIWQVVQQGPVSFDRCNAARKEWTTLVGDADRKNWWIETRSGRDPTVIRKLALDLPPMTTEKIYLGSSAGLYMQPGDVLLCHEYGPPFSSILDPTTGKVLRRFSRLTGRVGTLAGHGSRLAFVEEGFVRLFDVSSKEERSVKLEGGAFWLTFSPDGKLLACISVTGNTLYLIDWEKAVLIEPIQPRIIANSLKFVDNNTILLEQYRTLSRWRWDGTAIKKVSPGINLGTSPIMHYTRSSPVGQEHVCTITVNDWPWRLKSVLHWLEEKKVPVERWFPKRHYFHWIVLDNQDRIIREYYEDSLSDRRQLYDQLSVEVKPDKQFTSSTITLWNDHPTWPNAAAMGVVVYLLLYTLKRLLNDVSVRA